MAFWFGRKSAAPDVRAYAPAWLSANEQSGFARSYEAQFDEVFRRNPVGQRAVRLVAGMLGSLTVDGDERAVKLVRADGLLEGIAAQLLLHGNSYAQLIVDEDGLPAEIVTLRPERISVVADERGWPTAYLYRVAGRVTRFERCDAMGRRQVAHLKSLHPRDDHYGLGCLEAACAAATQFVPRDYRLRGDALDRLEAELACFFEPVADACAGDVLVLRAAPDQLHLGIQTDRGFIHADAGLRRVVETPGMPLWPILSAHRRKRSS